MAEMPVVLRATEDLVVATEIPSVPTATDDKAASPTIKQLLPEFSHHLPSLDFVDKAMSSPGNRKKAAQQTAGRKAMLARGHTGKLKQSAHSIRSIAALASSVLPSWSGVELAKITVKDVSGQGGSKAFKVSSGCDATPPIVALHSRSEQVSADPVSERRAAAAAAAMRDAGVAPMRLAEGGDWYIVEWGGTELGWPMIGRTPKASPEDVGRFLAMVHKVPTDWWAPFEAELLQHIPQLTNVARGSCPWWFSARTTRFEGTSFDWRHLSAEAVEAWAQACPKPASAIGAKLVTSHGDFHGKNILLSQHDASLRVIDFEFSGVFEAALDLGYAFVMQPAPLRTAASKRAFVRAYIEETTGQPASADDVEALAIDAEAATLAFPLFSPLAAWVYFDAPERFQRMVADAISNVIDKARRDAAFREKVLAKGALRYAPGWWVDDAIWSCMKWCAACGCAT